MLDWRQPNGWLKDRACRDVMRQLDELGIIKLPPPLIAKSQRSEKPSPRMNSLAREYDFTSPVTGVQKSKINMVFAKGNKYERLWNALIGQYHYLGHRVVVGRNLKYLFFSGDRILGAIGFSSPAWRLQSRDSLLAQLGIDNPLDYTIDSPAKRYSSQKQGVRVGEKSQKTRILGAPSQNLPISTAKVGCRPCVVCR